MSERDKFLAGDCHACGHRHSKTARPSICATITARTSNGEACEMCRCSTDEQVIASLTRRIEELEAENAALRQFRDDVVTVERASGGRHVVDIPADAVVAQYANLAAAIRAQKEGR